MTCAEHSVLFMVSISDLMEEILGGRTNIRHVRLSVRELGRVLDRSLVTFNYDKQDKRKSLLLFFYCFVSDSTSNPTTVRLVYDFA